MAISEVFNEDNMVGMARYADKHFDLAIIDPPYRDMIDNQPTKDMRSNGSMDNFNNKPSPAFFNELYRVSKNQIIWGANNFQLPPFMGFVVWKKKTIGETFTMSMCEIASLSKYLGTTSKWIEIAPQDPNRFHPTQKPVQLYKWLLKNYAKEGDKILDTHLGSGSSRIACWDGGFDFTGFELDKEYYDAQEKRFNNHKAQLSIF